MRTDGKATISSTSFVLPVSSSHLLTGPCEMLRALDLWVVLVKHSPASRRSTLTHRTL